MPGVEPCIVAVAPDCEVPVLGIGKGKLNEGVPVVALVGTLVTSLPEEGTEDAPVGVLLNPVPEGELGEPVLLAKLDPVAGVETTVGSDTLPDVSVPVGLRVPDSPVAEGLG